MISEEKFLQCYGNFLVQAWSDETLKARFKGSPADVLKEFGLDPKGAKVRVIPPGPATAQSTQESQVQLWNDGVSAGSIDFYFPETPPEGTFGGELSDADLEAVAGGWSISCCCCTPCCSC